MKHKKLYGAIAIVVLLAVILIPYYVVSTTPTTTYFTTRFLMDYNDALSPSFQASYIKNLASFLGISSDSIKIL